MKIYKNLALITFCLLLGTQMAQAAASYTSIWDTDNCSEPASAPWLWNTVDDVYEFNLSGTTPNGSWDNSLGNICRVSGILEIQSNDFSVTLDGWKPNGGSGSSSSTKDFHTYNGICITYSLTGDVPIKVDLLAKQRGWKDANYWENNAYTSNKKLVATTEAKKCLYLDDFEQPRYYSDPVDSVLKYSTGFKFRGTDEGTGGGIFTLLKIEMANLPTIGETIAGTGAQNNPYIITNEDQLVWIAKQVNAGIGAYGGTEWDNTNPTDEGANVYYELGNDIDLSSVANWTPIGNLYGKWFEDIEVYYQEQRPFRGNFDGRGHKIKNLNIKSAVAFADDDRLKGRSYGLFGTLAGNVKNLGVENVNINLDRGANANMVGAIAGTIWGNGQIENCYANGGAIRSPEDAVWEDVYFGGIAGYVVGSIKNSYSAVDMEVHSYPSYIYWGSSSSSNSYAVYTGGIAGYVIYEYGREWEDAAGSIKNSMALGSKVFNQSGPVARIANSDNGIFANNKAFAGMFNTEGTLEWANKGSSKIDGEDILPAELQTQSGYLAIFASSPWTYLATELPGLNSQPVTMPEHLKTIPTTITRITISPKTFTMQRGDVLTFTATIEGTGDYESTPVVWSRAKEQGAIQGTTTINNGVLTIASNEAYTAQGIHSPITVTASIIYNGVTIKDEATITVQQNPPASITGDLELELLEGYAATSTSAYIIGGSGTAVAVTANESNGKITWNNTTKKLDIATGLATGSYKVTLKATNSTNTAGSILTFTFTVLGRPTVTSVNVSPRLVTVQKDGTQDFTATVNGANNPSQNVTWTVTGNLSPGTIISRDGVLYIDPSETATTLKVRATSVESNPNGVKYDEATVGVSAEAIAPVIDGLTSITLTQGYSAHSEPYVLSGTKPISVSLDDFFPATANSHISWNSSTDKLDIAEDLYPGTYKVTIKALNKKDNYELPITLTITPRITGVTVAANNSATSVKKGKTQAFTATVSGTGDYSHEVTWSLVNNNYSYIDETTGILHVSEYETATSITVRATSAEYPVANGTAVINIIEPNKPIISTEHLPTGTAGVPYSQTLVATSVVTPITWTKTGGYLPLGVTLSAGGKIEGTPNEYGTFLFTVIATNDDGSTQMPLSLTIYGAATVSGVNIAYDGSNSVKKSKTKVFTATVTGSGDVHDAVTWSITGNTSAGTTINASGLLTVAANETATSITVKATSDQDNTKSKTVTISVVNLVLPQITTPEALPAGTEGITYNQTLAATSDVTPIYWSIKSGSTLPSGLNLVNNKIEGTPFVPGSFTFTIVATNEDGSTERTFSLEISGIVPIMANKFANPLKAWMQNGSLYITGLSVGKTWSVYTASGALVSSGIASSSNLNVNLNAGSGVYYIKSNGQTFRIVNR